MMRTRSALPLALAGLAGISACKSNQDGGRREAAAEVVATPPASKPAVPVWPAGPLQVEHVKYVLALYFQPEPKTDPLQAVARCSAERSGLRQVEPGVEPPDEPAFAVRRPAIASFAVPTVEVLAFMAVGLDDAAKQAVQKTVDPLVLTFAAPGEQAERLLRLSGELMACLAERTAGLVWDDETRQLFARAAWQEQRVLAGRPLVVRDHMVVHAYEQDGAIRMVSLGMAKLGLPDLVIQRATSTHNQPLTRLMKLVAQELYAQKKIEQAGRLDVELATLATATGVKEVPRGGASLEITRAEPEQGDADNSLMELSFGGGGDEHTRQIALLRAIFGDEPDQIIQASEDDAELNAASERARARLPDIARRFEKGLPVNQRLIVKARFTDGDAAEWMWIEVRAWKGKQPSGVLVSRPEAVKNVQEGAQVTVEQDGIFDYVLYGKDGVLEGGETNQVLERRSKAE